MKAAKPEKLSGRDLAVRVLVRVVRDEAFAAAALDAELSRAVQLDDRERALCTELVYGTLRALPWIVGELDARAKRPTRHLPWEARAALWIAVEQLLFTRVPPFAAVDAAVTAVRRAADARVAGFANALLRRISEARPRDEEGVSALRARALYESCPADLRDALARSLGEEGARSFLTEDTAPPLGLRVREASARADWVKRIAAARPSSELALGRVSPLCILARGAGKPQSLPGYDTGDIAVQEEGSQLVALALDAKPGEVVLDACAGRGNKTGVLAVAGATVDACDRDPRKLDVLREELKRLRSTPRHTFAVDWTVGSGDVAAEYDAVLVDAPCSGIGTLRRRPELLLRRREPLAERTRAQAQILRAAAAHVRPGGRLVYAVCSVLREEAEEAVESLMSQSFEPAALSGPAGAVATELHPNGASTMRLLPYIHGTDGYFLASFRKRG